MENTITHIESKKTFNSTQEIIQDPIFISFVNKNIDELQVTRNKRPACKPGFRYKRDWYDRMRESGQIKIDFFINNIFDIWNKKSTLNSEVRNVIEFVCNKSLQQTIQKYNEQTK